MTGSPDVVNWDWMLSSSTARYSIFPGSDMAGTINQSVLNAPVYHTHINYINSIKSKYQYWQKLSLALSDTTYYASSSNCSQ